MRTLSEKLPVLLPLIFLAIGPVAAAGQEQSIEWISFPDARFEVRGLPWHKENAPDLWRLPAKAKDKVPQAVWKRASAPDGGRICFRSTTTSLRIRIEAGAVPNKKCVFDAFVNGALAGSVSTARTQRQELVLFQQKDDSPKEITLYLPIVREVRLLAIGLDKAASVGFSHTSFARKEPIVCYGSSVMQGTGATHPSSTYAACVARALNLDFVNLGFGGAGKAEPEVVNLVSHVNACCYVLDLGKSYGTQGIEPYARMLEILRSAHPQTPIVCITPIYSKKEATEPSYRERSEELRRLMRKAAQDRTKAGEKLMFVAEGLDLFGEGDSDAFTDLLHPNDEGNERMAKRLKKIVASAIRE